MNKKLSKKTLTLLMLASFSFPAAGFAETVVVDESILLEMQEKIRQQQAQFDVQAIEISQMQEQLAIQQIEGESSSGKDFKGLVNSRNDKVEVKLYGQVNRGIMYVNDGKGKDVFYVDVDSSSTRLGLKGKIKADSGWSASGRVEVEYQVNASDDVSMTENNPGGELKKRYFDFYLKSKNAGKVSLGRGSSATADVSSLDLSGTTLAISSKIKVNGGAFQFFDKTTNSYIAGTDLEDVFQELGGSKINRIKYDTAKLADFSMAICTGSDNYSDLSLNYSHEFSGVEMEAILGYAHEESGDDDKKSRIGGSASLLFKSGLNFTLALGQRELTDSTRDDPGFYYTKIGYKFGSSAVALDYGQFSSMVSNDDDGDVFGIGFVQKIKSLSSEFYIGYRNFKLDRSGTDLKNINSLLSGVRFKF
jgi:hypothetical protein